MEKEREGVGSASLVDTRSGYWHGGGGRHKRERLQEKNISPSLSFGKLRWLTYTLSSGSKGRLEGLDVAGHREHIYGRPMNNGSRAK